MMMPAPEVLTVKCAPVELGRQDRQLIEIVSLNDFVENGLVVKRASIVGPPTGRNLMPDFGAAWQMPKGHAGIEVRAGEPLAENSDRRPPLGCRGEAGPTQNLLKGRQRMNANSVRAVDNQRVFSIELIRQGPPAKERVPPNGS